LDAFGITMIEMLIAAAILSIMVASLTTVQRLVTRQTVKVRDQVYASQKALQMMDELRTLVQIGETQGINVLDDYDQGNTLFDPSGAQSVSIKTNSFSPVLTTLKSVTFAGSDVSLNRETGNPNEWRYLRNVYIRTPRARSTRTCAS
jgi:Tfp pilus assembly protein PilV